jgi:hypothetical protein
LGGAFVAVTAAGCSSASIAVVPPRPGAAVAAGCARLAAALPDRIEGMSSRATTPKSPLVHAWGKPPVILRCGVPAPPGIAGAELTVVNGVRWLERQGADAVVWTALRPHNRYVQLTIPTSYPAQAAYLVDLAGPLKRAFPAS